MSNTQVLASVQQWYALAAASLRALGGLAYTPARALALLSLAQALAVLPAPAGILPPGPYTNRQLCAMRAYYVALER